MEKISELLTRYAEEIEEVWGYFDHLVVTRTLTEVVHPRAMEGVWCFDIGRFAEPLRESIRDNALKLACCALRLPAMILLFFVTTARWLNTTCCKLHQWLIFPKLQSSAL
ncbi:MAG: hypothetical protein ACK5NG_04045 [Chthoniobacterales bacterium]